MSQMEQRFIEAINRVYQEQGADAFFRWFDGDVSKESAIRNGFFDFAKSVLNQPVADLLESTYDKTALEIGYGGARLLYPAASMFREAIGVDIHQRSDVVEAHLRDKGMTNFRLFTGDGKTLPVPDGSVDFVYSHIVLLHLSAPEVFENYLKEAYRTLRKGGIASLFYGRAFSNRAKKSPNLLVSRFWYALEPVAETVFLDLRGTGYRTFPERQANDVSLLLTRRKARSVATSIGFEVIKLTTRRTWLQGHLVLHKP